MNVAQPKPAAHCLEIFLSPANIQYYGESPLLYAKQEDGFRHLSKRETAVRIADFVQALAVHHVAAQARIAFYTGPGPEAWMGEWGTLASGGCAVVIPHDFALAEVMETLKETQSRLVFTDTLARAEAISGAASGLRDLTHIVCLEGGAPGSVPVISWGAFLQAGRAAEPPDMAERIARVVPQSTAIFFYYRHEGGARRALHYTHALLLEHARGMDAMVAHELGARKTAIQVKFRHRGNWREMISYGHTIEPDREYIRNIDTVLAMVPWEHGLGHIAAYYIPIFKDAAVQLASDPGAADLVFYRPHVVIARAQYLEGLREAVERQMRDSGAMRGSLFQKALALGKIRYETMEKLSPPARLANSLLLMALMKPVQKLLGGRLRLVIGIDTPVRYETHIFFYTFGVELVELPADNFKAGTS